jgi:hypothetical protein
MMTEGGNLDIIFQGRIQNAGTGKATDIFSINSEAYLFQMFILPLTGEDLRLVLMFIIF